MPDDSDADLIAASLPDPPAFAALFDRYALDIHRFVARRLGSQAADDLLGEVFLTAFRRRHTYDLSRPLARPWLYGIATNLLAGHRREQARQLRLAVAAAGRAEHSLDHAEDVATRVDAIAWRGRLTVALAELPDPDRDVLLLIAWEDFSYAQVAEALAIPVGTVRSRLNRARRVVRHHLAGTGPLPAAFEELLSHG